MMYIISKTDLGYPHTAVLSKYDDNIVVPMKDGNYQYIINADTKFLSNLLLSRILEELYWHDTKDCTIRVNGFEIPSSIGTILDALSQSNEIITN